ncbi:MAG: FHA domain-containing protein [Solirubrobacteraceae bacterium]
MTPLAPADTTVGPVVTRTDELPAIAATRKLPAVVLAPAAAESPAAWLQTIRGQLSAGRYLALPSEHDGPRIYSLVDRELVRIGRSFDAAVRFEDPTISRHHALIHIAPDRIRIIDERSSNGLFINGEQISASVLEDGDVIMIGRHRIHFIDLA